MSRQWSIQFTKKGYNEEYDIYCSQYHAKKSTESIYFKEMEFTINGIITKTFKWEIYQIAVNEEIYWKKQKKLIKIECSSDPS